jgi:hypothetical protein
MHETATHALPPILKPSTNQGHLCQYSSMDPANATACTHKSSYTHAQYVALQQYLMSKISLLLFPNLTHKTETGTAKGGRLLIATHLEQSNHLANQQQVLGFAVPFASLSPIVQKCWVKKNLLSQTSMF